MVALQQRNFSHFKGMGSNSVAELLIREGAHINRRNNEGNTELILATEAECYYTVELLIEKGAHQEVRNNEGDTALDIAKRVASNYHGSQAMERTLTVLGGRSALESVGHAIVTIFDQFFN